jgi:hypothetical protein
MFDTLEMSLTVLEQLAPVETKIRQRRKSLADEIGRAAESVALNVSEARQRAGLDRRPVPPRRRVSGRAHHGAAHRPGARLHHPGRLHRDRRRAGSGSRDAVAAHPLSATWGCLGPWSHEGFIVRLSRSHDPWVNAAWLDASDSRCAHRFGCPSSSRSTPAAGWISTSSTSAASRSTRSCRRAAW